MKPEYLSYDSLEDRKEILYILQQLEPARRLEWLKWCCANSVLPNSRHRPVVSLTSTGTALEVFQDFWLLVSHYTVDVHFCVGELVKMVRDPKYFPQLERGRELEPKGPGLFIAGLTR